MVDTTQDSVSISGPVSFTTHYRATRAVVAHTKVNLFAYGFFVGIPWLIFLLMLGTGHNVAKAPVHGPPTWLALLGGPLLMFVVFPLIHAQNVWQMRRRNASIQGIHRFTVTPYGFESHGENFDVNLRWDAIHRVVETRDFFLLYISATWAHFIPKACASSSAQLQTIRGIIRHALGDKAKLRTT
jgi:hypothetical protein